MPVLDQHEPANVTVLRARSIVQTRDMRRFRFLCERSNHVPIELPPRTHWFG
jgi:hypothetical protein